MLISILIFTSDECVFLPPLSPAEALRLLADLPRMQWDLTPECLIEWRLARQDEALAENPLQLPSSNLWFYARPQ
jgi:hypothetical protein